MILWGAVLEIGLVLLITYTPLGNVAFGTAPIEGAVWIFVVPFAGAIVLLEELRKRRVRARIAR